MYVAGIRWSGGFCVLEGKYDRSLISELCLRVSFVVVVVIKFFFA